MKRTLTAICFLAIFFYAAVPSAFAASSSQDDTTNRVTVACSSASGPDFTFDPSPNTSMAIATSKIHYAIQAVNTLTDAPNGRVYGTLDVSTGYAVRDKTEAEVEAEAVTAPSDEENLDGGSWTWMGGSGT